MKYPKPSLYLLKNPEKYIGDINNVVFRSSWEKKFMLWCEHNPSVIKWGSESFPIDYFCKVDNKVHRYFIDFFVQVKTNTGVKNLAIEIKPLVQTKPPVKGKKRRETYLNEVMTYQKNQDKWNAATEWAKKNDFEFMVLTEKELGIRG